MGPRNPRPKICRSCGAKITYIKKVNSAYRITEHKDDCRFAKRQGMGGKSSYKKVKWKAIREKELPVNPLALMKLSPEKFGKKVNQLLESQY